MESAGNGRHQPSLVCKSLCNMLLRRLPCWMPGMGMIQGPFQAARGAECLPSPSDSNMAPGEHPTSFVLLRELTGSDLGWFAAARDSGRARGRQRGINMNAREVERVFPEKWRLPGSILVTSRRFSDGQEQQRQIRLQNKNWRLVGDKIKGQGLQDLAEGDYFWARVVLDSQPCLLLWDVVAAKTDPELHARIKREFSSALLNRMAAWESADPIAKLLALDVGLDTRPARGERVREAARESIPTRTPATKPLNPARDPASPDRKRIGRKLRTPGILAEIVKSGAALSSAASAQFISILDELSVEVRALLRESDMLRHVDVNHKQAWREFRGVPIGFVDGGMSNVASLGTAPMAIRVGSYVVTPGSDAPDRERFNFEIQLVDDLFQPSTNGASVYDDVFEDTAKLRDTARMCCELAGVLSLLCQKDPPAIVLLHGPLVNPVSPYALAGFPNFTAATAARLLPGDSRSRNGRDANFVTVYLEQLKKLTSCSANVCGVVERPGPSAPGPFMREIVAQLQDRSAIDAETRRKLLEALAAFQITDSLMLECVLEQGEYVVPLALDRQGPSSKIPFEWAYEISQYPRPLVTYVKTTPETMPVRVESFEGGKYAHDQLMTLIVHTSRLLPRYAFPVGLDIVDKHAKVPEWMSRQINVMLSAQLMRQAMDTGNPAAISVVRRILSSNTRDWLFRPDYRKP